jgi:hypothetical protein
MDCNLITERRDNATGKFHESKFDDETSQKAAMVKLNEGREQNSVET